MSSPAGNFACGTHIAVSHTVYCILTDLCDVGLCPCRWHAGACQAWLKVLQHLDCLQHQSAQRLPWQLLQVLHLCIWAAKSRACCR